MLKIKSKYKIAKRLGAGIFEKTQTQKFALSEARSQKQKRRGRGGRNLSDYGKQLLEKQKVRFTYGLSEKQFRGLVDEAVQTPDPAGSLYRFLEMRLDNVAYRIGLSPTRRAARQLVSHGHVMVNGRRMTIPSHRVKIGDTIAVRESSKSSALFVNLLNGEHVPAVASWLTLDVKKLEGSVSREPAHGGTLETGLDFAAVLEYYSR